MKRISIFRYAFLSIILIFLVTSCSGTSYNQNDYDSKADDAYFNQQNNELQSDWELEQQMDEWGSRYSAQETLDARIDSEFGGFTSNPSGCPNGCTSHKSGCDIKGNIAFDSGEKIYHVPGQTFYNDTIIKPEYGERWFCTEQEAIFNGWRKAYN